MEKFEKDVQTRGAELSRPVSHSPAPMAKFEPLVPHAAQRAENPAQYWEKFLNVQVQHIADVIEKADLGGKGLWEDKHIEPNTERKVVQVAGKIHKTPWVNSVQKAAQDAISAVHGRYKDKKGYVLNGMVTTDELVLRAFSLYAATKHGPLETDTHGNKTPLEQYRDALEQKYQPDVDELVDTFTTTLMESDYDTFENDLRILVQQANDGVAYPLSDEQRTTLIEDVRTRYYAYKMTHG